MPLMVIDAYNSAQDVRGRSDYLTGGNPEAPRRPFLASYSAEPILNERGQLWNLAVPFLKNGGIFVTTRSIISVGVSSGM